MTQEEKELLLKDLCARLPYEPKARKDGMETSINLTTLDSFYYGDEIILPYLRPMSSMSSKEWVEFCDCSLKDETSWVITSNHQKFIPIQNREDYLNSKHFDYRGLIEKGLALEAPEGMYH